MNQSYVDKLLRDIHELPPHRDLGYIKLIVLWSLVESYIDNVAQDSQASPRININEIRSKPEDPFMKVYITRASREVLVNCATTYNFLIDTKNKGYTPHLPQDNASDMIQFFYEIRNKIAHGEWQTDYQGNLENNIISVVSEFLEGWIVLANLERVFGK